jgi:hypothetical protein
MDRMAKMRFRDRRVAETRAVLGDALYKNMIVIRAKKGWSNRVEDPVVGGFGCPHSLSGLASQ